MTELVLTPLTPQPLGAQAEPVSQFRTKQFTILESDGDSTQTWEIPQGATILGWTAWNTNGMWGSDAFDPFFNMGDSANNNGYANVLDLSSLDTFDITDDSNFWSGYNNFGTYAGIQEYYAPSPGVFYPNGDTLTLTVSTVTPDGTGVFNVRVFYLVEAPGDVDVSSDHRTIQVTVPSADILTLFDTPVQLIGAQGTGKIVMPTTIVVATKNGVAPYETATAYKIGPAADPRTVDSVTNLLMNGPTGLFATEAFAYSDIAAFSDQEDWANQPIILTADVNPTDGEFDLILCIEYMVVQV